MEELSSKHSQEETTSAGLKQDIASVQAKLDALRVRGLEEDGAHRDALAAHTLALQVGSEV